MKNIENRILRLLRKAPGTGLKPSEIARELKISEREITRTLGEMILTGALVKNGKRFVSGGVPLLEGTITLNKKGEGFVSVGGVDEDFYISPSKLGTAMHQDRVRISPFSRSRRSGKVEAEVVEVIERSFRKIVGTFRLGREFSFVVPDDFRCRRDLYIPKDKDLGAKDGQKVVAVLERWVDEYLNPEGMIDEVLGFPDETGVDVLSVVKQHDLHFDFPKDVVRESEAISENIPEEVISTRLDFRKGICFTIDPVDAKDFDDAVSLTMTEDGNYLLGVHIADVSYYVHEASAIDKEAYRRGTSTYLVDRVIPMLPEKLSNNLCSLRPNMDRLAYSVFAELDAEGEVLDYDICETAIHSARRYTYEEVQKVINGSSTEGGLDETLRMMQKLSRVLLERRMRSGSIDFDTPEAKFKLDGRGKPVECRRKERLDSHRLVEEFMLLANQIVAKHVGVKGKPFLYRVHDRPPSDKLENFSKLLKALGHSLGHHDHIKPQHIQKVIAKVKNRKECGLVEKVAIRTMAKAEYSPENVGHFGLAFDFYSHFTSPIRRYPDLIVHRMLKEYDKGMTNERLGRWAKNLPELGKHTSVREKIATEAERESIKLKQVEFMQDHVGLEYDGIVSGVMAYGIYVEISEMLIEGLVHVRNMEDDHYVHEEGLYRLIGQRTKKIYRLGDPVRIQVVSANLERKEIDFKLVKKP